MIRQSLNQYRALASKHSCSICFLHHTSKRTERLDPSKNNILSGQGFEAKMRLVVELRSDPDEENIKHLCIVKGNYLGPEFKRSSYVLQFDPDSFLFTNTGQRTGFDKLSTILKPNRKNKRVLPNEISTDKHKEILRAIFVGNIRPKHAEIIEKLGEVYALQYADGFPFGKDRKSQLLNYLMERQLIAKIGNNRSPTAYYQLHE